MMRWYGLVTQNSIYGTGVHASATVDAGISVNYTLTVLLTDGVYRAGIITCSTVDAIVINGMCHGFTSL